MMKRKIKTVMETNLVTNEHHTKGHSQFVFQSRGMRGFTTGTVQENFTNHFGKVNIGLPRYGKTDKNINCLSHILSDSGIMICCFLYLT